MFFLKFYLLYVGYSVWNVVIDNLEYDSKDQVPRVNELGVCHQQQQTSSPQLSEIYLYKGLHRARSYYYYYNCLTGYLQALLQLSGVPQKFLVWHHFLQAGRRYVAQPISSKNGSK